MTHVLNVDMDAKCPQCGKGGSVNGGLCFRCADKKIKQTIEKRKGDKPMVSGIGEKTIQIMQDQARDLIQIHKRKIQAAFYQAEEGKMKVGLSINIQQVGPKLAIETTITYTVEKVSDKQSVFVDENQPALFAVEA